MQTKLLILIGTIVVLSIAFYLVSSPNAEFGQEQKKRGSEAEQVENKNLDVDTTVSPTESPPEPILNAEERTQPEEIVCPDDVKTCTSGGFGVPDSTTYLRRVPPTCEFPECPG